MTEAIPGAEQIADVGTKAITSPRLEELKAMMGMGKMKMKKEEPPGQNKEDEGRKGEEKIAMERAKGLIQLAGGFGQVKAQGGDEEGGTPELGQLIVLMALAMIGLA